MANEGLAYVPEQTPTITDSPEVALGNQQAIVNRDLRMQGLRTLGAIGISGLGIGALLRGMGAFGEAVKEKAEPEDDTFSSVPNVVEVPIPVKRKKLAEKLGEAGATPIVTPTSQNSVPTVGFGLGGSATSVAGIPLMTPAGLLVGGGSILGGYKLTDWLLKKRRSADMEDRVEEAKKRYRDAMLSQYSPEQVEKQSSINTALDKLSNTVIKEGFVSADTWGKILGGGLALGTGIALGTGYATYKYLKKRSPNEIAREALKERARQRAAQRPAEIFAIPEEVNVKPKFPSADDNLEKEATRFIHSIKAAIAPVTQQELIAEEIPKNQTRIRRLQQLLKMLGK